MTFQPLTSVTEDVYGQEDWRVMSDAYERAAAMLGRSPSTDPHAQRLAREVMRLFDSGKRDIQLITSMAVINEQTIGSETEQGRRRHSSHLSHCSARY
ncbi:hypothetical protein J2X72_004295 [Phyllobacterium sp. 1468]|uniref:hypothetical protein n=1 Tax=Phyllobacterium sp. 1468 TaxID=2817759 RepID=UPI001AE5C5A0|nr:hypothetical protein [Phyllobacterium sp. 1468]MDR6635481.1 hypothetical protein [Phyllobacterium sp. 1468]